MPLSSSGEDTPPDCADDPDDWSCSALLPPRVDDAELLIRPGLPADADPLNRMLARSYRALLAPDYAPALLQEALPFLKRPRPGLVNCGTYFLALAGPEERVMAAGGWTDMSPLGAPGRPGEGHVRHVATDPDVARQGLGRKVMAQVMRSARAAGIEVLHCQSTLTAAPFYESLGFETRAAIDLRLPNGLLFPAVQMRWQE